MGETWRWEAWGDGRRPGWLWMNRKNRRERHNLSSETRRWWETQTVMGETWRQGGRETKTGEPGGNGRREDWRVKRGDQEGREGPISGWQRDETKFVMSETWSRVQGSYPALQMILPGEAAEHRVSCWGGGGREQEDLDQCEESRTTVDYHCDFSSL